MMIILLSSIGDKIMKNPDGIVAVSILLIAVLLSSIPLFTRPRYRILEVRHRNGEIDYTIQQSKVFGFPGTWTTCEIDFYCLVLRSCDLEAAKNFVKRFEEEDAEKRGRKVIKKSEIYKS